MINEVFKLNFDFLPSENSTESDEDLPCVAHNFTDSNKTCGDHLKLRIEELLPDSNFFCLGDFRDGKLKDQIDKENS